MISKPRSAKLSAALLLLLTGPLTAQTGTRPAEWIREADLKADIYFLASDDMAGRNIGSIEDHIATDYIATEFLRLGLKPMGDNGTFFQGMEVRSGNVDRQQTTLTAQVQGADRTYAFDRDFRWNRQSLRPTKACGPIVFAGYGINAPEYSYSDFASIDLHGKIALVLTREPHSDRQDSKFMGTLDTYHAFYWEKIEELRRRGASGVLLIADRVPRGVKPIPASSPRSSGGPSYALTGEMWDLPVLTVDRQVADQLLSPSNHTSDTLQAEIDRTGTPNSFAIPQSSACMAKAFTEIQTGHARNVVALLEGSDPKLKAETVIVTAHHDHMGAMDGHIFNGADDNASGVAGLLGVARAMVKGAVRPRRSVLFIAYDGEERIFLGSYFFVHHPLVPLAQTVATLNMDMIGRDEEDPNWPLPPDRNVNMVNVLGTRYNPGLRRVIDEQNEKEGLRLDYKMDAVDPDSLWSRSDHFWFATLHIPQVEFQTGLHHDYHTEHDTWDRINYPKLTRIVRLVFLSVAEVANAAHRIPFLATGAAPDSTLPRQ